MTDTEFDGVAMAEARGPGNYPEDICQACGGEMCYRDGLLSCMMCGADATAEQIAQDKAQATQAVASALDPPKPAAGPTPCLFPHVEINDFAGNKAARAEAKADEALALAKQTAKRQDGSEARSMDHFEPLLADMIKRLLRDAVTPPPAKHRK